jgi:holo-[acyl-carrier protein] synthase
MSAQFKLPDLPKLEEVHGSTQARHLAVGMDLVDIRRIRASLDQFGERFTTRVFTSHERAYADSSEVLRAERYAARFAAKEAVLKAFGLAGKGVSWRDIETFRHPDGHCEIRLHGMAERLMKNVQAAQTALSLTHDGDYAAAIVVACRE